MKIFFKTAVLLLAVPVCTGWLDPFRESVSAGNQSFLEKKYDEAMDSYRNGEKYADSGDRALLSFNRGAAEYMKGDYEKAVNSFQESLSSDSSEIQKKALFNMGNALFRQNKKSEAFDAWSGALKIDPEYEAPRKNIEYLLRKQDQDKDKKNSDSDKKNQSENKQDKNDQQKKTEDHGMSGKRQQSGQKMDRAQLKNLLESMKKKPLERKKGKGNGRKYLEKNW